MNKQLVAKAAREAALKNFSAPWHKNPLSKTGIAYAVATTFSGAKAGFYRKRTNQMFLMPNTCPAGKKACVHCGVALNALYAVNPGAEATRTDRSSTWHYDAKTKKVYGGSHYYCSWGDLMGRVLALSARY